jgi:hypothetical protein
MDCLQCSELEAEVAKLKAARKELKHKLAERDSTVVQVRWPPRVWPLGYARPNMLSADSTHKAFPSKLQCTAALTGPDRLVRVELLRPYLRSQCFGRAHAPRVTEDNSRRQR